MIKKNLRPYELSLWTLQDSFITVLKPIGLSNRGQIETPKCLIKDDGTQELTFSIPMYYRDNGEFIENPIWYDVINGSLIVNLRKIKLIFNKGNEGEEIFEFVISKVVETHTDGQLKCEVTAEGLAFQELGKIGYKISLKSEDFINEYDEWAKSNKITEEPKNNLNYWCDKLFKNSRWDYEIQMDWSSYDGIIVDKIFVNYKEKEEDTEFLTYSGPYNEAPPRAKKQFNENRASTENGKIPLRRLDKIYEEEYISSWETIGNPGEESLVPSNLENFKEKLQLVDLEKSNTYNNSQKLAEIFGVHCKYVYSYDENYHIVGKKCVFYNNFLSEQEGKIDIIYPHDTSKIEREIDSADVVTKMFVTSIEDSTSPSGLITIADVAANKIREDYILNFDYLYSIGTISQEQYDAIADYERSMYLINVELEPLAMQIANLQNDLVTYQAQLTLSKESRILDKEQMEQSIVLLDSITKSKGYLYKNLDTPYRGTLSNSADNNGTYYIKISQEGVDLTGKFGYPLREGGDYTFGIRLYYYAEVPGETEGSFKKVLVPYAEGEPTESNPIIFPNDIKIEKDEFGNITGLSNISLRENAISKNYFVTFAYKPELHYQNIYDAYARKLAEDEAAEKEAETKIAEIEDKIKKIKERYNLLLEDKAAKIADFENMMGPALKEGSWQAENYKDYGSKFVQDVVMGETNESHVNFIWDTVAFEEEQLLYYEEGVLQKRIYYPCIDISDILNEIKDNLNDLSFIYYETISGTDAEGKTQTHSKTKQMTIGSEMEYAFIKNKDGTIKAVLLLTDKNFILTKEIESNCFLGVIKSTIKDNKTQVEPIKIIDIKAENWIKTEPEIDPETKEEIINFQLVYPRLRVDSLLLKTSENELIIKLISKTDNEKDLEKILRDYYDYSVLIRGESYLITLKNKIMVQNGSLDKTFNIAYALSNAALSLYLNALEVSKTNAFPQVSYQIEVSALNEKFMRYAYKYLNRIVSINDSELKFEDVQGYISELDLDLDNPWEDEATVQNYKTKFEDLFSTIVASSEQMKTNSFAYNNAASAFGPGGVLKPSIIQNTINQSDLTYAFQSGNLTIDEVNGIWARSDAGVVAMRGGGIFCATQTDSNGNWLWNTGIMPSGINASLITAGQIDTNLIKIYAGDDLRLQLNADGLFAYNVDNLGEADLNQYVVHNSNGLFLVQPKIDDKGNKLDELIKKVEISWNGLVIRNPITGKDVFRTDDKGNLSIEGTITATNGKIGPWEIVHNGLRSNDGFAGLACAPERDNEGNVIGDYYKVFWATGVEQNGKQNQCYITNDGTLFCNNIRASGFISSNSFIGNTSGDEINGSLKNISLTYDGARFIFDNKNYDGNLIVDPTTRYIFVNKNALTPEEFGDVKEGFSFYYNINIDKNGNPIDGNNNSNWKAIDLNDEKLLIWKPESLTFILKDDIMYVGQEEVIGVKIPHSSIFFKVVKEGRSRKINPETLEVVIEDGKPVMNDDITIYSNTVQFFSDNRGIGKYATPMNPPSYTFIQDQNNEIQYAKETTFSVELTGFDLEKDKEELENSYWSINGIDCGLRVQLVAANTQDSAADEPGAAVLISDDKEIIINGEKVEEPYTDDEGKIIYTSIDGRSVNPTPGIDISLIVQEGKIIASAVISNTIIPEGGNIVLSYHIGQATRSANCFKIRNGSDGINIIMRSSSGYTLTSGDTKTELSTEIYFGQQLMNGEDSETQFYYVWKKDDIALSNINLKTIQEIVDEETLIKYEEQINPISVKLENGFGNEDFFKQKKIYVTSADFGIKSNYSCDVFSDKESAREEYLLNNENQDEELEFEKKE